MPATPTDAPTGRRLWAVPTSGSDDAGYWCSCSSTVLPSPSGEIALLEVDGELDMASLPAVVAMLHDSLSSPASHIVVSLSGMAFCSVRGAALLFDAGTAAAWCGIGYSISGAPAQLRSRWAVLFPSTRQPVQFRTTERAVADIRSRPPEGPEHGTANSPNRRRLP